MDTNFSLWVLTTARGAAELGGPVPAGAGRRRGPHWPSARQRAERPTAPGGGLGDAQRLRRRRGERAKRERGGGAGRFFFFFFFLRWVRVVLFLFKGWTPPKRVP